MAGHLFERAGEVEGARVRITSVPYALRASDADTLGGRPASAYVLAPPARESGGSRVEAASSDKETPTANIVLAGTPNLLAKYVNGSDVGNSAVYEANGMVGVGTTTPLDYVHVRFNDPNGATTGLAVQNLGNTATSYSGTLFYDQFGALGQFQGFNNVTHEYRINNIARVSPGGAFNGSINFMLGGASKFIVASNGNIGIGTTAPSALLEVSNAIPGGPANMWMTSFTNAVGPYYMARRARGTAAAPTAVQNGDGLAGFYGEGYGTAFGSGFAGGMTVQAAQNWTNTAHGTALTFTTTSINATAPATRMTIASNGNVGIGTTTPSATVEAVRDGDVAVVGATSFSDGCCAGFVGRMARGTAAAPAAVQLGDPLALFQGDGYGATDFSSEAGGMVILAAENWTNTAQGSAVAFTTTPLGSTEDAGRMVIMPDGNVGIGTFTEMPTIADKLQVFGDIRVGTTGTNGCLRNFAGTGIAGSCSSDRRFKKDITPFSHVLEQVTALQPVHYSWRAADFPAQHFGEGRAYGLIAQDVEQVLPELVVTNDDGFKAVDYSALPLLTIQAVKDLKSENDALKQRVSELERLVNELLATSPRR